MDTPSLDEKEYLPWFAFRHVKGLGCVAFKNLVEHLGDPRLAFEKSDAELAQIPGLEQPAIQSLRGFSEWELAKMEMDRVANAGARIILYNDKNYPTRLRNIADPPPLLYMMGELGSEMERAIAVVGSRSASDYGLKITRDLCYGLSSSGFVVVSGMARGIDGQAHEAALEAGGTTMAVLGCGVDVVYPPEHKELYHRIRHQGAILSDLSMGTQPLAFNFPSRNRLISGLAMGVVVVEATEKSGSLITANLANEQGREVFAVPGPAGSSLSRGTHRLIRQGAKLVERVEDILEELAPQINGHVEEVKQPPRPSLPDKSSPETRRVFELIQDSSRQIDEIIQLSGISSAKASEILLDLELLGLIKQLPGKRFRSV
ncbi:MAG: DNA-protecting protein DprA [Deltaproteobacteria bacterium]|nr:DNA-protecting protein DprA [Deltaproteobacteria bacterium]